MTADRRLRVGGWAALLVAILAPLELGALFLVAHESDPFAAPAVVLITATRAGALLAAAIRLDGLFVSVAAGPARTARTAGITGSILLLAYALLQTTIGPDAGTVVVVGFAGRVLTGAWFIAGGVILMSGGRQLARVGWAAGLGGVGTIAAALAIAVPFGGPVGVGSSWLDWFLLLGLFVVVYLVRVWSYVVRGRLPGPGIL